MAKIVSQEAKPLHCRVSVLPAARFRATICQRIQTLRQRSSDPEKIDLRVGHKPHSSRRYDNCKRRPGVLASVARRTGESVPVELLGRLMLLEL